MAKEGRPITIVEAITQVMKAAKRPMSPAEIYQAINNERLYTFGAKNPMGVVATQLRRHTQGAQFQAAAKLKLFERSAEGTFYLLE